MPLPVQALGGLAGFSAERLRRPRPVAEALRVAEGIGQLVRLGGPVQPEIAARERVSILFMRPVLLREAGLLEVFEPHAARATEIIVSEALRIQAHERIEVQERVFVSSVGGLVSPVAGREAARTTEVLPYVSFIRSLIEQEKITAARRMLDAAPPTFLNDPRIARLRKVLAPPTLRVSQKRDTDRSLDYQWIRDHRQEYRGRWVALHEGRLLAAAASLRGLLEELKSLRLERAPLIHHIQ